MLITYIHKCCNEIDMYRNLKINEHGMYNFCSGLITVSSANVLVLLYNMFQSDLVGFDILSDSRLIESCGNFVLELFNTFYDDVTLKMVKSEDARSNLSHSHVLLLSTWTEKTGLSVLYT